METQQKVLYGQCTLRGEIRAISPVTYVGEKKTALQNVELFVPGYHNGFEQVSRDQLWQLQALGKKVADLQLSDANYLKKRVVVTCYLDSQYILPREEGQNGFYSINATIANLEFWK